MNKIDPVVIKETKYIAVVCIILSVLMQSVFLVIGKWDYTVLLGNILSAGTGVLNFFLLGLSVAKALTKDEKDAKSHMKLSQTYRMIMLTIMVVIGVTVSCFNMWAVLIALIFPRIAIAFHPLFNKNSKKEAE